MRVYGLWLPVLQLYFNAAWDQLCEGTVPELDQALTLQTRQELQGVNDFPPKKRDYEAG